MKATGSFQRKVRRPCGLKGTKEVPGHFLTNQKENVTLLIPAKHLLFSVRRKRNKITEEK